MKGKPANRQITLERREDSLFPSVLSSAKDNIHDHQQGPFLHIQSTQDPSNAFFHIILNTQSGPRKAQAFLDGFLLPLLEAADCKYDIYSTLPKSGAREVSQKLSFAKSARDIVVLLGGDGTVHEFVEGLADLEGYQQPSTNLELVTAPLGTANALYHSSAQTEEADDPFHAVRSLVAVIEGDDKKRLRPLSSATVKVDNKTQSALVVASTALHAAILWEAERMRDVEGVERFKKAVAVHWGSLYPGILNLKGSDVRKYSPSTKTLEPCPNTSEEGPWAYLTGCLIDRLEATFVVAPLRSRQPEDGSIDVVAARCPSYIDKSTFSEALMTCFAQMYAGGAHIDLVWVKQADGKFTAEKWHEGLDDLPVMEYWRCEGYDWAPAKAANELTRTVCIDGSLAIVPEGKQAEISAASVTKENRLRIWT